MLKIKSEYKKNEKTPFWIIEIANKIETKLNNTENSVSNAIALISQFFDSAMIFSYHASATYKLKVIYDNLTVEIRSRATDKLAMTIIIKDE